MTQQQLLGYLRRYIKALWDFQRPYVTHGSAYNQWKAEYDNALKALDMLEKACAPSVVATQPALVAEPMPELDKELSLKVDQLDKQIDNANSGGQFARATALRARKGQMMRAAGL
jgi:hypothetical protein